VVVDAFSICHCRRQGTAHFCRTVRLKAVDRVARDLHEQRERIARFGPDVLRDIIDMRRAIADEVRVHFSRLPH
jgi:hypothetical protein